MNAYYVKSGLKDPYERVKQAQRLIQKSIYLGILKERPVIVEVGGVELVAKPAFNYCTEIQFLQKVLQKGLQLNFVKSLATGTKDEAISAGEIYETHLRTYGELLHESENGYIEFSEEPILKQPRTEICRMHLEAKGCNANVFSPVDSPSCYTYWAVSPNTELDEEIDLYNFMVEMDRVKEIYMKNGVEVINE